MPRDHGRLNAHACRTITAQLAMLRRPSSFYSQASAPNWSMNSLASAIHRPVNQAAAGSVAAGHNRRAAPRTAANKVSS